MKLQILLALVAAVSAGPAARLPRSAHYKGPHPDAPLRKRQEYWHNAEIIKELEKRCDVGLCIADIPPNTPHCARAVTHKVKDPIDDVGCMPTIIGPFFEPPDTCRACTDISNGGIKGIHPDSPYYHDGSKPVSSSGYNDGSGSSSVYVHDGSAPASGYMHDGSASASTSTSTSGIPAAPA